MKKPDHSGVGARITTRDEDLMAIQAKLKRMQKRVNIKKLEVEDQLRTF